MLAIVAVGVILVLGVISCSLMVAPQLGVRSKMPVAFGLGMSIGGLLGFCTGWTMSPFAHWQMRFAAKAMTSLGLGGLAGQISDFERFRGSSMIAGFGMGMLVGYVVVWCLRNYSTRFNEWMSRHR